MSQEQGRPVEFSFPPTVAFGCILCGDIDLVSANCPNVMQACVYCGGPLLVLTKMCSCCGIIHVEPEVQVYQEVEEELCPLCRTRSATINGMCEFCNFMLWKQRQGEPILCVRCSETQASNHGLCRECAPPSENQYEEGGPSIRLTPWTTAEDCNETRYSGNYWDSSPGEGIDLESVGSCDWLVISSDNE